MERTLKGKEYSYSGLFNHIGKGNKLHVPLSSYSKRMVQTKCSLFNQIEQCDPMNNKFATSTTEKDGYITITQRY